MLIGICWTTTMKFFSQKNMGTSPRPSATWNCTTPIFRAMSQNGWSEPENRQNVGMWPLGGVGTRNQKWLQIIAQLEYPQLYMDCIRVTKHLRWFPHIQEAHSYTAHLWFMAVSLRYTLPSRAHWENENMTISHWLVVWNMNFIFHFIYGAIPNPLTNSIIFQDGFWTC